LMNPTNQELVFTTTGKTPVSGFSKAKKQLDKISGVNDWRLHDLRRTFATVATETLGYEPVVVDRVLNHVSGSVKGIAAVYQKGQYLDKRKIVLDAWAGYVQSPS
jgi:integrase